MHGEKLKNMVESALLGWLTRDKFWVIKLMQCISHDGNGLELYQLHNGRSVAFSQADRWELFPDEITIDFSKTSIFVVQSVHPKDVCEYVASSCLASQSTVKEPYIGEYTKCPYYSLAQCAFFRRGNVYYTIIFDPSRQLKTKPTINCYPLCQSLTKLTLPYFQNGYEGLAKIILHGEFMKGIINVNPCAKCPYMTHKVCHSRQTWKEYSSVEVYHEV